MNSDEVWEELGKLKVMFWMCPVPEHAELEVYGLRMPTVEWQGDVAYCLTPGCRRSSKD